MSNGSESIRLSTIALAGPPADLPASHPFKNVVNHKSLIDFIVPRLEQAAKARDSRVGRFKEIDKQLYGWIKLAKEDEKRNKKRQTSGQPYATHQHVPLTLLHLEDTLSFFSGIFAPSHGMFSINGSAEQQEASIKVLRILNGHAKHAGYYRAVMRAVFDVVKYQQGGLITEWDEEAGFVVTRDAQRQVQVQPTIVWEGSKVYPVDMYNSFWPAGVPLLEIGSKAEFFAQVELVTPFELQRRGASGEWFNLEGVLKDNQPSGTRALSLYKFPPQEMQLQSDSLSERGGLFDFLDTQGVLAASGGTAGSLHELINLWIWLNPLEHKLISQNAENRRSRNRLELWKLQLLDSKWLISATHATNAHGKLPVAMGSLNNDSLEEWQKSRAELLKPLQDLMSFLLNTHIDGVRKNIWGLVFYDETAIDLKQLPEGEVVGRVPVRAAGMDKPVRDLIHRESNLLDTSSNLRDFEQLLGLVRQLLPSQSLPSQIAGIDRAVDRQVAAVLQGANRVLQTQARLLTETMLTEWRTMLYFNLLENLDSDSVTVIDDNGNVEDLDVASLVDAKLEYVIGQGFKAIDKQNAAQEIRQLLFAVLQSQQALQQIDVVRLMSAWAEYLELDFDLDSFRIQQPQQPQQSQQPQQPGAPADQQPAITDIRQASGVRTVF